MSPDARILIAAIALVALYLIFASVAWRRQDDADTPEPFEPQVPLGARIWHRCPHCALACNCQRGSWWCAQMWTIEDQPDLPLDECRCHHIPRWDAGTNWYPDERRERP